MQTVGRRNAIKSQLVLVQIFQIIKEIMKTVLLLPNSGTPNYVPILGN